MNISNSLRRTPLAGTVIAALLAAAPLCAQAPAGPSKNPDDFLAEPPKPPSIKGDFTLVAIGDMLYSHPMAHSADPKLQEVITKVRDADFAVSNQEGVFIDLETFDGTGYGLGQLWGEGRLANDMKAMGLDLVSVANNHSTDFGSEGLLQSMRLLDAAGIGHAGGGRSLAEARRAGFVDTPNGRIAMVATASTVKENARANDAFGGLNARAGISTLRLRKVNIVSPSQFAAIRKLASDRASPREPAPAATAKEIEFGKEIYRAGSGDPVIYEMDLFDHADLLKSVRAAKAASDLTIFTIHAHESPTGLDDDTPAPPNFLKTLFHDVVDAGADVVVGGGPHSLRGIEIYKGRPIFHGIGVFFIRGEIKATQEAAFRVFPDPATGRAPPPVPEPESVRPGGNPASWYDSMLAEVDYRDGRARRVRVYPLDVGNTRDRSRRGIPHLADPETARRILENLRKWSADLGTRVRIEGETGIIDIE
ncbi:CapA family protein [Sphingopyxis sp.]|uniref:CapA family protein n=1 Tax=Sphingopyxis sp. TaxID=1908224 RepID=UPI002ED98AA0